MLKAVIEGVILEELEEFSAGKLSTLLLPDEFGHLSHVDILNNIGCLFYRFVQIHHNSLPHLLQIHFDLPAQVQQRRAMGRNTSIESV